MELVYLWVEDYKNIHKQGFNFSPKFTCNYDEKTNKLTIDTNDDYIENFFGDNINVTAIVGKNGSGKSSVFEILTTFSFQEYLDEKTFLVFFDGNSFSFKQSYTGKILNFKIDNKTSYLHSEFNKGRTIDSLYFGNELSTIFNNPRMLGVHKYLGEIDAFKDETFDLDNLKYINKEKVIKFEIFNKRFHSILKKNNDFLKDIDAILMFDKYRRELHFYEMISSIASDENIKNLIGESNLGSNTVFNQSASDNEILLYKLLIIFRLHKYKIKLAQQENTEESWKSAEESLTELISKINTNFHHNFTKETFWSINETINESDGEESIYSKKNVEEILTTYESTDNEIWIQKKLTPITVNSDTKNTLITILEKYGFIRIEYINSLDENYNYFMLSSGERNYIEIFVAYIYKLIVYENQTEDHNRKFLFLFDEIELGLHPNWQKRLIEDLVSFANKYFSYPIQLIISSHSPFLLSDIPKQNIIFLDKDEKGKCEVVDGLKEKKQTFGANIHTLLSDSFFMEDGLMGEFAKGKIDKAIKLLNQDKLDEKELKYCEQIISIIGEPIVKNQLQRMLDSKRLKKVDEIDNLYKEIELIKHRIDILRKD